MGSRGLKPVLSKEDIIAGVLMGKTITSIVKGAGLKSKATYYQWRRSDPDFRKAVDDAFKNQGRRDLFTNVKYGEQKGQTSGGDWITAGTPEWQKTFLTYLDKTRDRVLAADRAGKNIIDILKCLDPEAPEYDHEFAKHYEEYHVREAVAIEDEAKKKALAGGSESMQKYLLPTLPIVGDKYKKIQKEVVGGDVKIYSMIFGGESRETAYSKVKEIVSAAKATAD